EKRTKPLAGFLALPPVRADLLLEVGAKLGGANPGAKVVRRVEPRVHVGEVAVRAVAHARRIRQPLGVTGTRPTVLGEAVPELELELELRRVPPEEQRLDEHGRLRVLRRL